MAKIDLNIKLIKPITDDKGVEAKPYTIAIRWIGALLERSFNQPDKDGRATSQVGLDQHRRYFNIMNKIDAHVDGIVELSDDDISFIKRYISKVQMPVQRDVTEILVAVYNIFDTIKEG